MSRLDAVGYPLAFGNKFSAFSRKQADMNRKRQIFFLFLFSLRRSDGYFISGRRTAAVTGNTDSVFGLPHHAVSALRSAA